MPKKPRKRTYYWRGTGGGRSGGGALTGYWPGGTYLKIFYAALEVPAS